MSKNKCEHERYKVNQSHGKKSRGVPVCKDCGKVIKEEMRKRKKDKMNESQRIIKRSKYND